MKKYGDWGGNVMGKASKRVKRQQQKKQADMQQEACQEREREFEQLFSDEDYTGALEVLAELIKAKDLKSDYMYKGAFSFFMLGDMDRAAQWVNNTLSYAPEHTDARLLLAKICFLENRSDEGLAIYDFLWEHSSNVLSDEQKERIKESADYYVRRDKDRVIKKFPHLSELLQLSTDYDENKIHKSENLSNIVVEDHKSSLVNLKARLMNAIKGEDASSQHEENQISSLDVSRNIVAEKIAEINGKKCSLKSKLTMLNRFAAGEYMQYNFAAAKEYLEAALEIDDGDEESLKNMAITAAAMGEFDKAQALVTRMTTVDFVLLQKIKDMKHVGTRVG